MAGHLGVLDHSYTSNWVLEDALDDLGEGGASKRLGEDVCNHVTPRKVTKRNHRASNRVTEELGSTKDVLRLLEEHVVKGKRDR